MKLFTKEILSKLKENGKKQEPVRGTEREIDFEPVVKIFTPDANATWLLSEITPEEEDIAFGLCDLGMGFPELGSVRISELESIRGKLGLPAERDLGFHAQKLLSEYAADAHSEGYIRV